ncbi:MAG: LamG-like jellyroll fold domain-containing protein [Planctomycetota bacterium]
MLNERIRRPVWAMLLLCLLVCSSWLHADLVAHWRLDGDLSSALPDGASLEPSDEDIDFAPSYNETLDRAASFDSDGRFLDVSDLTVSDGASYSIAFWVRGLSQPGSVVYVEQPSDEASEAAFVLSCSEVRPESLAVSIVDSSGSDPFEGRHSTRSVFDGQWHHVAWIESNGAASLWIDGIRDATEFVYEAKNRASFDRTTIGALRVDGGFCCGLRGEVDDLRLFDHAMSEADLTEVLSVAPCPLEGDTHCGSILVDPPEAPGEPYIASALGVTDDSGDDAFYVFRAESASGSVVEVGPTEENAVELFLAAGLWTVEVRVDDDSFCSDVADDATCRSKPFDVGCPPTGDTHCGELLSQGPGDGGPGRYQFDVIGAFDDSGDEIFYSFVLRNSEGRERRVGPQKEAFVDVDLQDGRWTVSARVDDDLDCDDEADDARCEIDIFVGCPSEGDTHCDGLAIESRARDGIPGAYEISVLSATDDSGDLIFFTYRAERVVGGANFVVETEAIPTRSTTLHLGAGQWNISVFADDSELCGDEAPDARCEDTLSVEVAPPELVAHWPLDGFLDDISGSDNHGEFVSEEALLFTECFDGQAGGAIDLDTSCVAIDTRRALPSPLNPSRSVLLWVRGDPQSGEVWSEGSRSTSARFSLGADGQTATGGVRVVLRGDDGSEIISAISSLPAFDGEWHHIAWVEDEGRASLYVDGVRDEVDVSYRARPLRFETSVIGCLSATSASSYFLGAIDDVRVYSYALDDDEIHDLLPADEACPVIGDTHCATLEVEAPAGSPVGDYTLRAVGATDESDDAILYTFTAERADGVLQQSGPSSADTAVFRLGVGSWTLSVAVDDDLGCFDAANDARCEEVIQVGIEGGLVARYELDGDLSDAGPSAIAATFVGEESPTFATDRDGSDEAALSLDGVDDHVILTQGAGLPLYDAAEYSVSLWVRGQAQEDRAVWSESAGAGPAVFQLATNVRSSSGQLDVLVRDSSGADVLRYRRSTAVVFDGEWHHVAWVDRGGDAALYVDGVRDQTDFSYERSELRFERSVIGASLDGGDLRVFEGDIDDVALFASALSEEEIAELAELDDSPAFHRGDPDGNGRTDISDGIFTLNFLFLGGPAPECSDSADANDDGALNLTDAVFLLNFLFLGGDAPLLPGPATEACGPDPADGASLGCENYPACAG